MKLRHITKNGAFLISTVRLGVPIGGSLYETMVFRAVNGKVTNHAGLDADSYETEDQAKTGHEAMVAKWEAETP